MLKHTYHTPQGSSTVGRKDEENNRHDKPLTLKEKSSRISTLSTEKFYILQIKPISLIHNYLLASFAAQHFSKNKAH